MLKRFLISVTPKIVLYCLWAIYIQLTISFVCTPILIYWGLPISSMSIIGNFIFAPFLFLFIFLSFIIFSTELINIPNYFFCTVLDQLSTLWIKTLALGSPHWLIGFAFPGIFWLVIFALSGAITIWLIRSWHLIYRLFILSFVLISGLLLLKYAQHLPKQHTLAYHQTTFIIENKNNTLTLTIPRTTLYAKSFSQWFSRTAHQELYKTFGHTRVQKIVLVNPTPHTQKIIQKNKETLGYQELALVFE